MMTLYYRPDCPYCRKVLDAAQKLGIRFELKDINDPAHAVELVERGGKRQVPYLVDAERNVAMYESDDIVAYVSERAPKQ